MGLISCRGFVPILLVFVLGIFPVPVLKKVIFWELIKINENFGVLFIYMFYLFVNGERKFSQKDIPKGRLKRKKILIGLYDNYHLPLF